VSRRPHWNPAVRWRERVRERGREGSSEEGSSEEGSSENERVKGQG